MFFVCHEKHKTTPVGYHAGLQKNTHYFCFMQKLQPRKNNGQIVFEDNQAVVGEVANKNKTKDVKVGFASGKLGDKTYVVMVMF